MKAETRFTKQGTKERHMVTPSAQIVPAQRGTVMLRLIVNQSNESLDVLMSKEECQDLIERLQLVMSEA